MTETTTTYCARHPKVETAVTCASCGKPICPKCMVYTPVGIKCRECGLSKGGTLFKVSPGRLALAFVTALAAGVVAALLGHLGFLVIFVAMGYGYFAGSVILKASGMKRGLKLEIITVVAMVIGALALKLLPSLMTAKSFDAFAHKVLSMSSSGSIFDPFFWIALVISSACAVSKIRYL